VLPCSIHALESEGNTSQTFAVKHWGQWDFEFFGPKISRTQRPGLPLGSTGGLKRQFWANFDTFGRSCTDPLLPMRAKFGVLEQTQALHLPAKFHLNVFIVSASGGKKPQFWTNFDIFGGSCIDPLLPMRAKFGVL